MDNFNSQTPDNNNNDNKLVTDTSNDKKCFKNHNKMSQISENDEEKFTKSAQMQAVKRKRKNASGQTYVPQKRKKSSEKERQRNLEIKAALSRLSRSMPFVKKDLSRIRTLRLAKEYIQHLKRILQGEMVICEYTGQKRPLSMNDFERIVHREMQTNNSYKERAEFEMTSSSSRMSTADANSPALTPPPDTFFIQHPRTEFMSTEIAPYSEANINQPQQSYISHHQHYHQLSQSDDSMVTVSVANNTAHQIFLDHALQYKYMYHPMQTF